MKNVQIIVANIEKMKLDDTVILPQIAPRYADKYKRFKVKKEAAQELMTGYLLKQYLNVTRDEQLYTNEHSKPFLCEGEHFFNISHSGDYVVLAIADCDIGVDVEKARKYKEAIAKRVFDEAIFKKLQQLEGEAQNDEFSRLWTECEAVLKLRGTGFSVNWEKVRESREGCIVRSMKYESCFISCAAMEEITVELLFEAE